MAILGLGIMRYPSRRGLTVMRRRPSLWPRGKAGEEARESRSVAEDRRMRVASSARATRCMSCSSLQNAAIQIPSRTWNILLSSALEPPHHVLFFSLFLPHKHKHPQRTDLSDILFNNYNLAR